MIEFWSYKRELEKYKKEIYYNIQKTLNSGQIFFGSQINKLEKNFIKKYKSKYAIAVGSGTDALFISLKSLGIKKGDEVITAANTAIPTISAIRSIGAVPKLVDIGEDYLINTSKIKKLITKKTKAIIPVHLYGQTCNMDEIKKISEKYKLKIIEDCAQSQGSKYRNKYCGTIGDTGCFSFYPTKILGAYGDGGLILTNNFNLYKKIKRIRFYGIETIDKKNFFYKKYFANEEGINSRIDEVQASILNFKFTKVNQWILRRRQIANIYFKNLSSTSLILPTPNKHSYHVYHLFTVYHPKRDKIMLELKKKLIQTRIIYQYPIHKMTAYKKLFFERKNLKNSENKSKGIFCLPLYPEMKDSEVLRICKNIKVLMKKLRI
jgi:aminotransferase EvaB